MKIVEDFPPNFKQICKAIPSVKKQKDAVFTYGDTIYNPYHGIVQDHLDIHESVHEKQQTEMGVEKWWAEYLKNPEFRLKEEVHAYRLQYKFVYKMYGWQNATMLLKEIAKDLSGDLYGNILTYEKARNEISRK